MLADAGGIGYGEYLQVFTKKTNLTNYDAVSDLMHN